MGTRSVFSVILLSLISFASHADTDVLRNDVQLVFKGANPATGELIFEGSSIGDYGAGSVRVFGFLFGAGDNQLFVTSQWSFAEPSGAFMTGATSGRVELASLSFFERGTILTCFEGLSDLCGCAFQLEGSLTDLAFIPDVTSISGRAGISVPEGGDCLANPDADDEDDDEDDEDDDD